MARNSVTPARYLGLTLTVIATIVPYVDRAALTDHIRVP
jgi:hypothetical protein